MKKVTRALFLTFLFTFIVGEGTDARNETGANSKLEKQTAAPSVTSINDGKIKWSPDRLLVKYKKQIKVWQDKDLQSSIEAAYGLRKIRDFGFIDVHLYQASGDVVKLAEKLRSNPDIEYVEPDYIVYADQIYPSAVPNDPYFNNLWGLHNTGQTGGTSDADIDAPEAWNLTTGSPNVVVAVIDTGVDYNHPDLMANIWTNPGEIPGNGIDDDGNGYTDDVHGINAIADSGNPLDDYGHGTHCAGIIGAVGNNGIGITGVCWTVRIMALKFLNSQGYGYMSDAIECIQYGIAKGAHIINASWGSYEDSQSLNDAIEAAKNADILFVAAAGNDRNNNDLEPAYPASSDCDNIISVAASDDNDHLASFSNYGPSSVDVAAPGVNIYSTLLNNGFDYKSGTSMATPHVTGLAALIKSYFWGSPSRQNGEPNPAAMGWQQIKNRILSTAEQNPSLAGKILTGGRINAQAALASGNITAYSLNIESSPWAGAPIDVTPHDMNGQGSGTTNFARTYPPYTEVTLTAPAIFNGRRFGYWILEGTKYSFFPTMTIKTDFNHKAVAVYPIYTLTVESTPDTNVLINVSPPDENGLGDGTTNFTRKYQLGTDVYLTAPLTANDKRFIRWLKDGQDYSQNPSIFVNMQKDISLSAYYSDKLVWVYPTGYENRCEESPAIGLDGTVYFVWANGLLALNPNGSVKWQHQSWSSPYAQPAIAADGTIYYYADKLYAVSPNGARKWEFNMDSTNFWNLSPAIGADQNLYCPGQNGYLYALSPEGTERWKFYIKPSQTGAAIGYEGTIYIGNASGNFYAINPDGTKKWEYTIEEPGGITGSPIIGSDGTIYFVTDLYLYALAPDGSKKWKCMMDKPRGPSLGSEGTIYLGFYTGLAALNPNGTVKWLHPTGDWVSNSSPAIGADETIYFGSRNNYFYALSSDGTRKWDFRTGGGISSSPAIAPDGTIYFTSGDGYIYALKSESPGLANASWPKYYQDNQNTGRAHSSLNTYILTIESGSGGTTNPSPGAYTYDSGASVAVTVLPGANYRFDRWTGAAAGNNNPLTVTMDGDKTIKANFLRQYTLTIEAGEGGTTSPAAGAYKYDIGTSVVVAAVPGANYRFGGWTGAAAGSDNPLTVIVDGDKTVRANFLRQYTLTIEAGEGGTTSPAPGTFRIETGTSAAVTAVPNTNYKFNGWTGNVPGGHENDNPLTVIMNSDKSLTANFLRIIYPPLQLLGQRVLNRSLSQVEYIDVLTWNPNPNNENIVKYRVYLVEGNGQNLLAEVGSPPYKFQQKRVDKSRATTYSVLAVNNEGREGEPASITIR